MPLFDRLTENGSDNGHRKDGAPPTPISPILPGRSGRPSYSLEALREQVEAEFQAETANRPDILLDLDTEAKQRAMLREIADYVLGQEVITLSAQDKTTLIDKAYRNLFALGPLDEHLSDDTITEITINGPRDIHVRRGLGSLESVPIAFDDPLHLRTVIERVVATGGAVLSDSNPFLEIGVVLAGRAARISLVGPPISPQHSLEIRLHPRQPLTLDDLYTRFHAVPPQAADLLTAILRAQYGLLVVGDAGVGKTTLVSCLLHALITPGTPPEDHPHIIAIERAAEMHLPAFVTRRIARPPTPDRLEQDFAGEIRNALDERPHWLIVDEIRGDESAAVWDALSREDAPRYVWIFRGDSQPDRLRSALTMVIRKQQPAIAQDAIHRALARHLPFITALKVIGGTPRLHMIAETVFDTDDFTLTIRPLLCEQDGGWLVAENRPTRPLDLPDDFWF
jgi:Flp pilus assembly CpaF family ATPase